MGCNTELLLELDVLHLVPLRTHLVRLLHVLESPSLDVGLLVGQFLGLVAWLGIYLLYGLVCCSKNTASL